MLDDFDDLRLRELVLFDRTVALGTISAAARELGLPKPTAGRWLAVLEARTGRPLLHRGAREVSLTDAGRAFHEQCQAVLRAAGTLRAVSRGTEAAGTLRVSVPVPFGRLLGGSVIAAFHARLPAVRLEVRLENRRVDLLRDRVDLAIRGGSLPDSDQIARRLAQVSMWLYAPTTAPNSATLPLIAAPGDEALLAQRRPELGAAAVVVDDRIAVRDAVLAGTGVGILPSFLGEGPRARGELVRLGELLSTTPVHAVWLREQRGDIRLRTLVEVIERELAAWVDPPAV